MKSMTMRERMQALVEGRPHDRVPFVQYSDLGAPNEEAWALLGRENLGLLQWACVHELAHPNCSFEEVPLERGGRTGFRQTLHTPQGSLFQEKFREPTYNTAATHKHFVKEPQDYKVLMAYLRDVTVRKNLQPLGEVIRELGDDGLPHVSLGRTPYQQLWIQWVCLEDLAAHLVECPDLMEEVTGLLGRVMRSIFDVVCEAVRETPIPYVVFGDNVTAPVIGERYFRKYCVPYYRELTGRLAETGRDVPVFVHMDGDLKPLWGDIGSSGVRGLDSLSPPPDNDTSAADVVRLWPQMRLGVNFPSSVHLAAPERVYAAAREILQQAGSTGRLQIQISENVPPGVWRRSFPQIVRAVCEFGAPGRA